MMKNNRIKIVFQKLMDASQKLTTVIQKPLVATHCFLTVVRAILVTLETDFLVLVGIFTW